jgi:hypothetical protein
MNNTNIELVADGQPSAVIVISQAAVQSLPTLDDEKANPEVPADKIAWAAHDLQVYLEKMSGAEVPIVGDDQPTPAGTTILVGRSSLTTAFDAEIPAGVTNLREEEGYAILTDDTTLVLAGNDQGPYHGTEYAVSFFLYSLGVRWYLPGEFGEVIPDHSTITVAPTREISRPDFKMRNWWTYWFAKDLLGIETRWKIHNGMNVEKMDHVRRDLLRHLSCLRQSSQLDDIAAVQHAQGLGQHVRQHLYVQLPLLQPGRLWRAADPAGAAAHA